MTTTYLNQLGIVPALLITVGGLLVLHSAQEEKAKRRYFLYLMAMGSVLLLILLVSILLTPPQKNRPLWQVAELLTPALVGVLALIVLCGRQFPVAGRGAQLMAVVLVVGLIGVLWSTGFEVAFYLLPGTLALVLGWAVGFKRKKTAVFIAIVLLLCLYGFNAILNTPDHGSGQLPGWLGLPIRILFYGLPGLIVVISAVLIGHSLQSRDVKTVLLPVALALALVGYLAYSIYWASIWDHTSDGLGGLVLSELAAPAAVGAGMVLTVALFGWRRSAGLLFVILAPLLLYQAFEQGWQVSYHALTEARAERISQALDDYFEREGAYPETLDTLIPRDLLLVPQPVELRGETWCYQGGDDFYRLGAFSREFFSMPVELQVYEAVGKPDSAWACEGQLAAMKERYYSPMEDPGATRSSLPTPMPPSETDREGEF